MINKVKSISPELKDYNDSRKEGNFLDQDDLLIVENYCFLLQLCANDFDITVVGNGYYYRNDRHDTNYK
jgi:hypothetical protein